MSIPFEIPSQFASQFAAGNLVRYGALLKDGSTGRIVAHLQETGALQRVVGNVMFSGPAGLVVAAAEIGSAVTSFVQNEQIKRRLDVMQSMLGGIENLQIASLVTSVAGIGVTVASTALILRRMNTLHKELRDIGAKVDKLGKHLTELGVESAMTQIETALYRIEEAPGRRDTEDELKTQEAELDKGFTGLVRATERLLGEAVVDEQALSRQLAALATASAAQLRVLLWLDMVSVAGARATRHAKSLNQLTRLAPIDFLDMRLSTKTEGAQRITSQMGEMRARVSSFPSLTQRMVELELDGRAYLEDAEAENEQPLLLLRAS